MFNRLSNNLQNSKYPSWRIDRHGANNDLVPDELNVTPPEACHPTGAGATRVTLNLPAAAADKLSQLAEAGGGQEDLLRELGILSLRVEGGQVLVTVRDNFIQILQIFFVSANKRDGCRRLGG